jgi:hypothetical protein
MPEVVKLKTRRGTAGVLFHVNIDGTTYEGGWTDVDSAAFGALRAHRQRIQREHQEAWQKQNPGRTIWTSNYEKPELDDVAIVVKRVK